MIIGTIKYSSRYGGLGENVRLGLEYLAEHESELADLSSGRHTIDGTDIYFDVAEITTSEPDSKLFEAHRKYIDVHVTITGEEWFGHAMVSDLEEAKPYDPEKDAAYYTGEGVYLQSPPGKFILFMPEDAHKPGVYFTEQGHVKKLVLKAKIS